MVAAAQERFAARYTEGMKLMQSGCEDDANRILAEAAKIYPPGWLHIGIKLLEQGETNQALARLNEVLNLTNEPRTVSSALTHIGKIICAEGHSKEALTYFERSSRLTPEFPDCWSNMALIHQFNGNYPEALRYVGRALNMNPWHEQAQFIQAMTLLLSGDYERGFAAYECRWRSKGNGLAKIAVDCPEWNGRNGQRLFVYGEQGHGDSILMLRYARMIRERGVEVCWLAQKALDSLARTLPEMNEVLTVGQQFEDYDCHIPSVSLPYVFGTRLENIPPAPYIPRPEAVKLPDGFNVGICWRGSRVQTNDKIRSTRLEEWRPILKIKGVNFHSLQVDGAEEGLLYPQLIQHPKPADFLETAKLMAGMDLVITVDTSIVHLAGAMEIPCWVAMHCRPYFVYPPDYGERTPWYDSVRLFRQAKEFEWPPVFEKIADELKRKIQS